MILAIYCAGGLGKEVLALAKWLNSQNRSWNDIIFVDDVIEDRIIQETKVYKFEEIKDIIEPIEFVIATGEPKDRETVYKKIKEAGYQMGKVISLYTTIFPGAKIGEGSIINGDVLISADAEIGNNIYISAGVIIGHNVKLLENSVISMRCFIGGYTELGNRVYLAPGAMLKDRIHVGDDSIVSMGAIVLRNVKEKSIMMGNPAKCIGKNERGTVFKLNPYS